MQPRDYKAQTKNLIANLVILFFFLRPGVRYYSFGEVLVFSYGLSGQVLTLAVIVVVPASFPFGCVTLLNVPLQLRTTAGLSTQLQNVCKILMENCKEEFDGALSKSCTRSADGLTHLRHASYFYTILQETCQTSCFCLDSPVFYPSLPLPYF